MASYDLTPTPVPKIKTRFRSIRTRIPAPGSIRVFEALKSSEPRSMMGQPPIVWHKADDFTVSDRWGNRWIDWSSGVLITNAGHGRREIKAALKKIIDQGLLASYVFVHEQRMHLARMLQALAPKPENYRVFLLTTGSEAVENCIKLAKTYAMHKYGPRKKYFVGFQNAFHGRTLGSQLAGGIPKLKTWIGKGDPSFIHAPFPDGFNNPDTSFNSFLKALKRLKVNPRDIAGVISETYQGGGADFMPVKYAKQLEAFCRKHDIVLCMDEVQAGFGRTGKWFGFQHYGIKPDLIACGKGISSSLPIAAVIGRHDIMNLYAPGSMTSTHSGSPLPVAAAIANLKIIQREKLVEKSAALGDLLLRELERIRKKHPGALGCVHGKGLVASVHVVKPGTRTPDPETALKINLACFRKGLLMFAPVGPAGECVKIAPPLTISRAALMESIGVFDQAVEETLGKPRT